MSHRRVSEPTRGLQPESTANPPRSGSPTPTVNIPPPYSLDPQVPSLDPTLPHVILAPGGEFHAAGPSNLGSTISRAVSTPNGVVHTIPIQGTLTAASATSPQSRPHSVSLPQSPQNGLVSLSEAILAPTAYPAASTAANEVLLGPAQDPYIDALQHAQDLTALYRKCSNSSELMTKHYGELVISMTRLLRKARLLDAISVKEEHDQLKSMLDNSLTIQQSSATASNLRSKVWRTAGKLLVDIENRLAEEHLSSGINQMVKAMTEVETILRRRSESRFTQ